MKGGEGGKRRGRVGEREMRQDEGEQPAEERRSKEGLDACDAVTHATHATHATQIWTADAGSRAPLSGTHCSMALASALSSARMRAKWQCPLKFLASATTAGKTLMQHVSVVSDTSTAAEERQQPSMKQHAAKASDRRHGGGASSSGLAHVPSHAAPERCAHPANSRPACHGDPTKGAMATPLVQTAHRKRGRPWAGSRPTASLPGSSAGT